MCARVTLDADACVRKTLRARLGRRVRRRPLYRSPEDTSQSIPIYFRFLSASLRLHLSPHVSRVFPLCPTSAEFRWSPKQIYRASFRASGTLSDTSLGRSKYRSRWRAMASLELSYPTLAFYLFLFSPRSSFCFPLRTSIASCRYVEFFINTLQTDNSFATRKPKNKGSENALADSILSTSVLDV